MDARFTLEEIDAVLREVAHQGSPQRMDEPLMLGMRRSVLERLNHMAAHRNGFTRHEGGPGVVAPAIFDTEQ